MILNTEKQETSNWTEMQSNTNWNNTHPNHTEQRLTQEEKINVQILKRKEDYITISKKPRLEKSQGRNWKNKLLTCTSMNNISELNELIYAGAKLVCAKIDVPLKNMKRNSKSGWEIRLETLIRNQQQQAKMIKPEKCWNMLGLKEKKQHNN